VVDPYQLASDIVVNTVSLALPALLWVLLFLIAWEHAPFAESIGLGRRAFWLLLPGAIFASFGLVPIAPVSTDWVAVSLAGALFPLLVGLLAFGRAAPPRARSLSWYLLLLAIAGGVLFVLVLPAAAGISQAVASSFRVSEYIGNEFVVAIAALAISATVGAVAWASPNSALRRVAFLFVLTCSVLVGTFVASSAIPGVGITEAFPFYLIAPIAVGFIASIAAGRVFPDGEAFAIPTAFLASTFGVALGADLLREPPLYGTGPSGVYTIGGAGVLDLVYLSGLFAFGAAYLGHRLLGRSWDPVGPSLSVAPSPPTALLARAFREGLDGQLTESIHDSAEGSRAAAEQARRLLGLPPSTDGRPWQGLPVPGWLVADQANLDASARAGSGDGREGFRAWRTARSLVLVGHDLGLQRFGTIGARAAAFAIDLLVVTLPAAALWTAMLVTMHGGLTAALTNVPFNAAIYGFIAWSFLYFVLAETFYGTTVGKRLLGLEVRERSFEAPSGLSALVRNTTTIPVLTVVGIGVAIALAFGLKAGSSTALVLAGVSLPVGIFALVGVLAFVFGGVALLGVGAVVVIAATAERQRLGDLWAGTWVVRRLAPTPPTSGAVPTGAVSPPTPPGADRSG